MTPFSVRDTTYPCIKQKVVSIPEEKPFLTTEKIILLSFLIGAGVGYGFAISSMPCMVPVVHSVVSSLYDPTRTVRDLTPVGTWFDPTQSIRDMTPVGTWVATQSIRPSAILVSG